MTNVTTSQDTVFKDGFSEEIWASTYKDHKDSSIDDTFRRVAKSIASAETTKEKQIEWENKFYDMLTNFKGVSGGRITANAGTDWAGTTFANCYVGPLPDRDLDSINGIYKVLVDQANTLKSEGGWGMDFSWIRPRGSFINGIGVESPGSVRFMELFDKSSEIVTAGSGEKSKNKKAKGKIRKGAMMATMGVWHPDIVEFIKAKQTPGRLSKFNMSVNCTDKFMDRVNSLNDITNEIKFLKEQDTEVEVDAINAMLAVFEKEDKWDLIFPDTTHEQYKVVWKGDIEEWQTAGYPVVVHETVSVTWMWNLIMESTYNRNEPGVLFLDRANYFAPLNYAEKILSTNPCVTGDTTILTKTGFRKIVDCVGEKLEIWNGFEWSEVEPKVTGENQEILDITFSDGSTLPCTPYHGFNLKNGIRKEAKDLILGDKLSKFEFPIIQGSIELNHAYAKGFYSGDGSVNSNEIWLYGSKCSLIDYLPVKSVSDQTVSSMQRLMVILDIPKDQLSKTFVPDTTYTVQSRLNWLAGMLDSDGCMVDGSGQIWSIDKEFLMAIKGMLNTLGTTATLSLGKPACTKNMPDGNGGQKEYLCLDCWRINISGFNMNKLRDLGMETNRIDLSYTVQREAYRGLFVTNISKRSTLEKYVYCFNEPKNHTAVFNALFTRQCGEQTLAPGGVCCLGTINLTQFVNKDYSGFNLEGLAKYVGYMVRFLDNVNEVSETPLPEYKHSMREKRRIGCGVMGWGSALFMLRVRFGSKKASELREQVMSTYARAAYMASIDLAEEKGMFSYCDPAKHAKQPFIQKLGLPAEYMEKLGTVGIRNSSLLSQQPNGNGSIHANIVSGGIEPIFMPEYIRTVMVSVVPDEFKDKTPNFTAGDMSETSFFKEAKEGDERILRGVAKDGTVYKIDTNRGLTKEVLCMDYGVRNLRERELWDPRCEYAVTTTELSVTDHVEDLKGFASWTDSACSKTCNIPNSYPFEDFKNLYLDVYNTGVIKGFTTYRDGTMTTVLSAVKETIETEEEIILEEIKLPDSLPAVLKTIRSEGRKWYLTVILNESQTKPVALFTHTNNNEKTVTANDAMEHLLELALIKGIPQKYIAETLEKARGDTNTTKICRMISLCLRHGVLIRNLVSSLDKVNCFAGTFVFHIRKFLATYIRDGEKVENEKCESCGSTNVIYQEGCKVCANCGSSKCG